MAPLVRPGDDAFDVITSFRFAGGAVSDIRHTALPAHSYRLPWFRWPRPGTLQPIPYEKLHPDLRRRLAGGPSADVETLLVSYEDTLHIPRFPVPVPGVPLTAGGNLARAIAAQTLVQQILAARGATAGGDTLKLKGDFRARVLDRFWLTRSYLVVMPRDSVRRLAQVQDVIYIRPDRASEPAPQFNGTPLDDPAAARALVGSDFYRAPEFQGGRIALLDTGVYTDHELLSQPGQFNRLRDCVNGGVDCNTGNAVDPSDLCPEGHGTASAALLGGRLSSYEQGVPGNTDSAPADDSHRGLTQIAIDSYRVYGPDNSMSDCHAALVASAFIHCMQDVLVRFGGVIAAEAQAFETDRGDISLSADAAFDGGSVVIAASGNKGIGPPDPRAPGNARRALGIGAYSVRPPNQTSIVQIGGQTADGRLKPDVQAPTDIETATAGNPRGYSGFGGTSCATAVAAGSAALLRNQLLAGDESIDPGFVYAGMIASGDRESPFPKVVSQGRTYWNGAGHAQLPNECRIWKTKLSVSQDESCEFPIELTGVTASRIVTAIWWPETARWENHLPVDTHSNLDLEIELPDGANPVTKSSDMVPGVFERLSISANGPHDKLVVRVKGRTVPDAPQTVYVVVIGYE